MKLVTVSGATYESTVEYHRGHWKNPMSTDEVEGKFRKLAANVLNEHQTSALLGALWELERRGGRERMIVRLTAPACT